MFYFFKRAGSGGTVSLKYINVMKDNESLLKYSRLNEVKEAWQLNAYLIACMILYWR